MGAQLRLVRRRIRAVQSTAKITRAQELIASSRIIKAQQRVCAAAQPYAREITRAVEAVVSRSAQIRHPLILAPREPGARRGADPDQRPRVRRRRTTPACCARRRGCEALLRGRGVEAVPFVAGRKGIAWHRFRQLRDGRRSGAGSPIPRRTRTPPRSPRRCSTRSTAPAADGGVDEIYIVHTEFVSMLTQRPVSCGCCRWRSRRRPRKPGRGPVPLYEFEPSARGGAQRAAAVVHGEPDLPRAARLRRGRDRRAAPGHEVRHRQRQRAGRPASPSKPTRHGRPRSPRKSARSWAAPTRWPRRPQGVGERTMTATAESTPQARRGQRRWHRPRRAGDRSGRRRGVPGASRCPSIYNALHVDVTVGGTGRGR